MNKNIYDTDCVTWSPQGRIFQIEYASEAVKLGTCVVGLRSDKHAVLVALRRNVSKLADYNDKVVKIDEHLGTSFSGITADANLLVKRLRAACLNYRYVYESPPVIEPLVYEVAESSQKNTQEMGRRPFGVGLMLAGHDQNGPHIFETTPSGDYFEYYGHSFGSHCQSARTYLENHRKEFESADLETLIVHGLKAMCTTVPSDQDDLPVDSIHLGVVGADTPFRIMPVSEIREVMTKHNIKPHETAAVEAMED